ncbi:alpha/beta fold hydrolase [Hymenobacter latericus]|uniref:alpha/beta fold hydrolase n=1 Tax=Hymenobacter sp. YIM 151858-1 TaxID=2987688 RepID=UPI002226216B|nr:alpha/beta hydrolase [Hymenobacter sp. YIM 151858-1]UYZ59857.1 alpha/beta hydrolase [Hymenobacter sp. YIM 151858-1]
MNILKRNNVVQFGSGEQAMVFVHGFGCDTQSWRFVAPAFASKYRLVLFDHVGAGKSDLQAYDPTHYNSLQRYANDLLEVLDELKLTDVICVGHSVGGMISLLAATQQPERFAKLVLIGASPRYINDAQYTGGFEQAEVEELLSFLDSDFKAWSNSIAPLVMGNVERPELTDELINSYLCLDPKVARQFGRVTFLSDTRAELPKLHVPTLIVQSANDFVVPVMVGEYLHRHLAASRLAVLDTAGHYPHLSAPVATISVIEQFLKSPQN